LSENPDLQKLIPSNSILTPHPGEFKRLAGDWKNDFDKIEKQKALALKLDSIIILKGAHTSIALPDGKVFFNSSGNPMMATGGSGDVLTGIITGLLAQRYSPKEASIVGVYLHGLAGDLAAKDKSAIIATDIIDQIAYGINRLTLP
jgi:NAD(P)H-hydrate epimerase